jgi:hypothetical protein
MACAIAWAALIGLVALAGSPDPARAVEHPGATVYAVPPL